MEFVILRNVGFTHLFNGFYFFVESVHYELIRDFVAHHKSQEIYQGYTYQATVIGSRLDA